jgi:hypothetical protein
MPSATGQDPPLPSRRCRFETFDSGRHRCQVCGREVTTDKPSDKILATCRAGLTTESGPGWIRAEVPRWEYEQRLAVCGNCQFCRNMERCSQIDLGCKNMFLTAIKWTLGKCPEGKWPSGNARWVTTAELAAAAIDLADQVPPDITRIVGVPRSGMIPAAIIASKIHRPLFTIRDWQVVPAGGGFRIGWNENTGDGGRWLFVDDTLHNGSTFARLEAEGVPIGQHLTAVVYTLDPAQSDLHHAVLPTPHLLEWNLLNAPYGECLATDFDGILCHNPPRQGVPKFVARRAPLRAIISSRPETEREASEAWLAWHGMRYQSLRLWPGSEVDRFDIAQVAVWKATEVSAVKAEFYIESEPDLADAIRKLGIRVLCPDQGYLA